MAYCTVTDIQAIIKSITFDTTSKVTTTEITNTHIPAADAIIDNKLRKKYTVPITDATDLVLIKHISMNLTAGIVGEILFETTSVPNENDPVRMRYDRAMALLDTLLESESLATARSDDVLWSRVEELYEEQDQDTLEPIVTIAMEF